MRTRNFLFVCFLALFATTIGVASCAATSGNNSFGGGGDGVGGGGAADSTSIQSTGTGLGGDMPDVNLFGDATPESCSVPYCSADATQAVDCNGQITTCGAGQTCALGKCLSGCDAASALKSSIGCEYHAVMMDGLDGATSGCFVAFVANTSPQNVHIQVSYKANNIDLSQFAKIPQGSGKALTYGNYNSQTGLPPGEVAILFLGGGQGALLCPIATAFPNAQVTGTSRGWSFKITTDLPVVAYQMLPYGGGSAAVTGATLLLPTSAWDTNYVAVEAYIASQAAGTSPEMVIVAAQDGTNVTLLPKVSIAGGANVPGTGANTPVTYGMSAGEVIEIEQPEEFTGSPIQSDKPIGILAGHQCLNVPSDVTYCDHAEQMIPPVKALGNEYAAVSYRQRSMMPENPLWRVIGAVKGTMLTYDPPMAAAPTTLGLGDVVEFNSATPFTVKSQDKDHPFLLVTYMSGSDAVVDGYGDPDFVRITAADQYLSRYVFFTDPTYPETNLVVIRKKGKNGFADVTLDCAGKLAMWTPLGSAGTYEWTRTDLSRHDFQAQGNCNNGRHEMSSTEPFGLWVWGWGTPETSDFTANVSYGYPAGENVTPINNVVIPPVPK